jgi:hypothetical protein
MTSARPCEGRAREVDCGEGGIHCSSAPAPGSATHLDYFRLRCWARARLYAEGILDLAAAVDQLQGDAEQSGLVRELGQDRIQALISTEFRAVR